MEVNKKGEPPIHKKKFCELRPNKQIRGFKRNANGFLTNQDVIYWVAKKEQKYIWKQILVFMIIVIINSIRNKSIEECY